jgi:hypothetical protein
LSAAYENVRQSLFVIFTRKRHAIKNSPVSPTS